jgi:hypothetical protein
MIGLRYGIGGISEVITAIGKPGIEAIAAAR